MFKLANYFFQIPLNFSDSIKKSSWALNISKVFIGDIISKIIAAFTLLMIIRSLSINDYAKYTAFYTVLILFPSLIGSGVNLAMIRFSSEYLSKTGKKHINLYLISFILQSFIYVIFCFFIFMFKNILTPILFGEKQFEIALISGAIGGFGFLVFQAGLSVYKAEEKFNTYIVLNWLRYLLILILIGGQFFIWNLKFENIAASIIFVNLCLAVLIIFQIFKDNNLLKIVTSIFKYGTS